MKSRTYARRFAAGLIVLATAVGATGCGSSDGGSTEATNAKAGATGKTTVTVGVQPATPFAVVPLGAKQGLFAKHGLDVKVKMINTATTIPPALLAKQMQFANWSYASFATLADKKLPLKIVGPGDTAGSNLEDDYTQLVVRKDSGITAVKQLAGKTIAVNSLASLSEAQTKAALEEAGVDPKSVKLVPIPYPDQAAALSAKRVDAVQTAEPFLTKLKAEGNVPIAALDAAIMPHMPVSMWMTSADYAKQQPDVVRAFQLGLADSLKYAQAHADAVRAFIPEFAGVDAATASKMILPVWGTEADPATIQRVADAVAKYGIVPKPPVMKDYVLPFPLPESGS